jgi:hypothetical protein
LRNLKLQNNLKKQLLNNINYELDI